MGAPSSEVNLDRIGKILNEARKLAIQYYKETGKALGITGEIAEFEAARVLGLDLCPAGQPGFDATRRTTTGTERIQIKGRRKVKGKDPSQRMGIIDYGHDWDSVVLVLLDEAFQPIELHQASRRAVEQRFPPATATNKTAKGPSVAAFKKIATRVWTRQSSG